jgi:hypothetical protein
VHRVLGEPQHRVHRDQDRELEQDRPTPRERVDAVLAVQLHDLFLLLLLVLLVLLLDLLHLRLDDLHVLHRANLLDAEGEQHEADHDRQDDDRHPVVGDQLVDLGDDPPEAVEQGLPRCEGDHEEGLSEECVTGSYLSCLVLGDGT